MIDRWYLTEAPRKVKKTLFGTRAQRQRNVADVRTRGWVKRFNRYRRWFADQEHRGEGRSPRLAC